MGAVTTMTKVNWNTCTTRQLNEAFRYSHQPSQNLLNEVAHLQVVIVRLSLERQTSGVAE